MTPPDDEFQHNEPTPLQGYQMALVVWQKQQFNALNQNGQQRCTRNARRMWRKWGVCGV